MTVMREKYLEVSDFIESEMKERKGKEVQGRKNWLGL